MKQTLIRELILPTITRLGSMLAGALIGAGMASVHGPTIISAFTALALFGIDLATRKVVK